MCVCRRLQPNVCFLLIQIERFRVDYYYSSWYVAALSMHWASKSKVVSERKKNILLLVIIWSVSHIERERLTY